METLKFKTNINCGGCVKAVTPKLNQVDSIKSWRVDTDNPDKILEVQSETGDQQPVIEAVKRAGFEVAHLANAAVPSGALRLVSTDRGKSILILGL